MSQLVRHRFDVEDYYRMVESGVLGEDDRVELIEGEIVEMSPIGSRHSACLNWAHAWFVKNLGDRAIVSGQNPVRLDRWSEPQPDLALLRPRADYYAGGHPGPADVLLLVEVADSSVETDRRHKIPLYAAAGIPEVWLVDLVARVVEVYTEPAGTGCRQVQTAGPGDFLSPTAFPDRMLAVDDLLP